jgi:hypothetical protein
MRWYGTGTDDIRGCDCDMWEVTTRIKSDWTSLTSLTCICLTQSTLSYFNFNQCKLTHHKNKTTHNQNYPRLLIGTDSSMTVTYCPLLRRRSLTSAEHRSSHTLRQTAPQHYVFPTAVPHRTSATDVTLPSSLCLGSGTLITILLHIREVPGSNIGPETGYPDRFPRFSLVPPG